MTRAQLVALLRAHRLMVVATNAPGRAPQSAVVGFGVSDAGELVFDTLEGTRKFKNLVADGRVSVVIGWSDEFTVQKWPGIVHVRVTPTWARVSRYGEAPSVVETTFAS